MRTAGLSVIAVVLVLVSWPQAQGTTPASPLTIITREGRRPVPTTLLNNQEFIALDELASLFQLMVREDALVGGITVTYKGRTIVASADQAMASVNGRVVTLPAPAARVGRRLFVPIDFIPRALAPIYDSPIDLRRASRLRQRQNLKQLVSALPKVAAAAHSEDLSREIPAHDQRAESGHHAEHLCDARNVEPQLVRHGADPDPQEIGEPFNRRLSRVPHEPVSLGDVSGETEADVRILGNAPEPDGMRDERRENEREAHLHPLACVRRSR